MFYSLFWSHGTLGFLVSADIRIIPAKNYVKVNYKPAYTLSEITKEFEKGTYKKSENDFIECIMFSKTDGVIMTGVMTDDAEPDKVYIYIVKTTSL